MLQTRRLTLLLALVPVAIAGSPLKLAAQKTQPVAAGTAAPPATSKIADPAAGSAEFNAAFSQWKQFLAQLRDMRQEFAGYANLSPEQQQAWVERFEQTRRQGNEMFPKVVAAAAEAYRASGGKNADLNQFLVEVARDAESRDDYETAAVVAPLLVDHGQRQQKLLDLAGIAPFHVNDFDSAEKYLGEAVKAGRPSKEAHMWQSVLAEQKKQWEREQKIRQAEAKADDLPRVKLETRHGDIVLELFENEAPNTVASFISLVNKGFYDGLTFHRVLPGFMAQGGCPNGNGTGDPGYRIRGEATDDQVYRRHFRGSLSMALGDSPDSGGSQFFITFVPTMQLNGKHTVFGRVVEGIGVLSRISRRDPDDPAGTAGPGDAIIKATVVRKRDHKYEPVKVEDKPEESAKPEKR